MSTLMLAPAATVVVRDDTAVQCGVDSRRAGIIEVPHPRAVAAVLAEARHPTPKTELIARLAATGLPALAATALVQELEDYRVLRHPPSRQIALTVLGDSPLARLSAALLREEGWRVRRPLLPDPTDLPRAPGPVLVVDCAAHYTRLIPPLLRRCPTFLPALLIDAHGFIGPARIAGEGACPLCEILYHQEKDPRWFPVLRQVQGLAHAPLPALHATAARLCACAAWLAGGEPEPPGHPEMAVTPGETLRIDPYSPGPMERREVIAPHPRCAWCRGGAA